MFNFLNLEHLEVYKKHIVVRKVVDYFKTSTVSQGQIYPTKIEICISLGSEEINNKLTIISIRRVTF